ncbi:D-glycero-beta-D-manno-heptose-7-phosphate kinase [Desulfosoma caldarium]|uniref:D-beta-D-heptose 7-phosphate kinase/D-beta-D-heptose 1-phosphate adenosyltransferase n=1 Tax=Desulfosoma caldarium TaxID=610254 RepID=A0A3N1VFY7_9BACT|nr:D-glycero-beta-D-manno-heptose-7-phosphate kinase [Desulfosoma caldarium]ROR01754.1 D-beta-D-heptose 7-phosphate kinase/D-beta-D-heptose 1-phosphate adenosyltransferase [Desulfosoma caldarium]
MATKACSRTHRFHRLLQGLDRFSQCTVLVLGDLMLDVFLWGHVRRISPEAPVPVVEVRAETHVLGGAANVVHNIVTMGGNARVVGVVGNDAYGREVRDLLQKAQVPCHGLVIVQDRPTTVKTRVIAQHQQVVRVDREDTRPYDSEGLRAILHAVEAEVRDVDAVVVSDYAKGVVSLEVMDAVRALAQLYGIPVFVDPKVPHAPFYHHVTLVTPNTAEALAMAGMIECDDASLETAGRLLLEKLQCQHVLITRGPEGMSLFGAGTPSVHIPTVAKKVFDVTGAGDTVIAAMALATAAGLDMRDAALLANTAAGIVVGEVGTAAVEQTRLRAALQNSGGCEE